MISRDIRRKRLSYRAWHRGTRESDLLLGRFADAWIGRFDDAQLDRFEALLECSDADLFDWATGRAPTPAEHDHDVTRLLVLFSNDSTNGAQPTCSPRTGEEMAGEAG